VRCRRDMQYAERLAEIDDSLERPTRALTPEQQGLRSMLQRELPEVPSRYLYDDRGSELFEDITGLAVYYQTRTELGILERHAAEIVEAAAPTQLAELGSGAGRKIRLLLDAWRAPAGASCTMLDVNASFVAASVRRLAADYPAVEFRGAIGDFTRDLARLGPGGRRMSVFFGGTLGNLQPAEQRAFFAQVARHMRPSDSFLVGVDLIKDVARIEAAYNDPEGVTAEFNKNALRVINHRFGADFDVDAFEHRAFYDRDNAWIEMRLAASRAMQVRLTALDLELRLPAGAEIRTEVSCKFTRASLAAAARGLTIAGWYPDPEGLFALALLRRRAN
jgi:L-histidine N-alpha-methyltransferase